jgi:hypothetical protein
LKAISNQGEAADVKPKEPVKVGTGAAAPEELSHFERFVEILQAFEKRRISRNWNPVRNVPRNPTTTTDRRSDPRRPAFKPTPITAPASLKWANLFNVRYRKLLNYLTHTFRLARVVSLSQPNTRGAVMARIFGEMYNLKTIAGILVRMPLTKDTNDPRRAGPPFQMPYTIELPLDEIDSWQIHRDITMNSLDLCASLLDPANAYLATTPPEGRSYLLALRSLDQHSITWFDTILADLRKHGGKHS